MPKETGDTRLVTILLIVVGALAVFPVFFMGAEMMGFVPATGGMWGGGMWDSGTVPGWLFISGIVMRLLFPAAIIGGGYLIYRAVTGTESDSDRAIEELRLAYARGDLTGDEYEQRREALERGTDSR